MSRAETLHAACIAEGIPTDNNESDLYIPDTPRTRELLVEYGKAKWRSRRREKYGPTVRDFDLEFGVRPFRSNIDGGTWFDVAFGFQPFWDRVAAVAL